MQNEQVAAFIELVELDQRLSRLSRQQEEEVVKKEKLLQEIDQIDKDVAHADKLVHDTQKKMHELELDLKTIDRNLARTQEKLLSAHSQKELDSLEHEKTDLENKRELRDEQGLGLLEELEQARAQAVKLRAKAPEAHQEKKRELTALTEQMDKLGISQANLSARRDELELHIDQELLSQYETMMKKVPNPAVPVLNESCSGCFYSLTPSELNPLRKGQLGVCKGCYRTIYITKGTHGE